MVLRANLPDIFPRFGLSTSHCAVAFSVGSLADLAREPERFNNVRLAWPQYHALSVFTYKPTILEDHLETSALSLQHWP